MRTVFSVAFCGAFASAFAPEGYVPVPDGWLLHADCIFNHPSGHIEPANYSCPHLGYKAPQEQIYRMDTHLGDSTSRQTSFNASWTVPELPSTHFGQVVYFWPGFKKDQPEMGYPVFQPVLQFGQHGSYWEFQSWFVYGQQGIAHTGPAIKVSPGDVLSTYMNYDDASGVWTCYGKDMQTAGNSLLTQKSSQMAGTTYFEYAMLVLETISVSTCAMLPTNKQVEFTGVSVNGAVPDWTKRVTRDTCGETITTTDDTVTMAWTK